MSTASLLPRAGLERAGRWFIQSGIQEPSGGVARFYRSEIEENKPVSTEITGYTASTLVYLFQVTGDEAYLDRARVTARFLVDQAWDPSLETFPFEHPSQLAWFFDCGIIIRGLLAVWRQTREDRLFEISQRAAHRMIADFHAGKGYHPVLSLPEKKALPYTEHWSRSPGCYQLKSAVAWLDIAEITGDEVLRNKYEEMLYTALSDYRDYLAPSLTAHQVMDRLHPYCYFLEALTPVLTRPECTAAYAHGIDEISRNLRAIAPSFARSDVYAQLLRARIYGAPVVPLVRGEAQEEASALASFQAASEDPRIDGGFVFGRREGILSPHVNPVSTTFALQALEMWKGYQAGSNPPCRCLLI